MGSTLGVKYDLILALRSEPSLRMYALKILQACLGVPAIGSVQKKMENKVFSYGNASLLLTFMKASGRWGHFFATSASPRS